ncbi:MAG TPA: bifunctional demethylmenaquinone methyltransferase/2-methoxy-6-polyprenyl-1,4-benzoquinol methylase UbiE [Bauldia sp.]|nr:bifunctional demethylmenaquinone methyltransferase/2-methoxy-6-polyprenyl-1,4-benzoquinol methylase UbiE [Bauldia sp.]
MARSVAGARANERGESASYGFRDVDLAEKQGLVDGVFNRVAPRYDLMNDLMSGGMHRLWKDALVSRLAPPRRPHRSYRVLDVAGGTGDIAFRVAARSEGAEITVADINAEMLAVGRERAARQLVRGVSFVEANAEALPFPRGRFDAVTIAFGIRNVPRIDAALAEVLRVLKPGGRFLCLEFSAVDVAWLDRIYDLYSFNVIPRLGEIVAGDAESYRYLVESIRRFPNQARFAAMIEGAGFERVEYQNLSGGIAAIHSGWKL